MNDQPTVVAKVQSRRALTPSSIELQLTPSTPLSFLAGQYVELSFPPLDTDEGERRFWPMAIASGPDDAHLSFCIRQREGSSLTPYLTALQEGHEMLIRGPLGNFGFQSQAGRKIGMIVTGTGIAPIRAIIRSKTFQTQGHDTVILFGAEVPDELPYLEELNALPGVQVIPVISHDDQWQGQRGWVTDLMASTEAPFDWTETDFYLCGHPAMQKAAIEILHAKGVSESAIFSA